MQPILDMTQFIVITIGKGTYRISNRPGRIEQFMALHKTASKPAKTDWQKFATAYKSQTRMNATPTERKRIMADLISTGDYQEYALTWDAPLAA